MAFVQHVNDFEPLPTQCVIEEIVDTEEPEKPQPKARKEQEAVKPVEQPVVETVVEENTIKHDSEDNKAAEAPTIMLEPPEDCEPVTADGGVLKKVLAEGDGDPPGLHARCLGGSIPTSTNKTST